MKKPRYFPDDCSAFFLLSLENKSWKFLFQLLDSLLQGNSIKVLRAKKQLFKKNGNKNYPLAEGHHTFFSILLLFFVLQKQTILFVQYLKDIQSDKAAQTTVKPKSTTVFCDQWFVQNRLQTCCKAVTLQLVLSFTDLTFP